MHFTLTLWSIFRVISSVNLLPFKGQGHGKVNRLNFEAVLSVFFLKPALFLALHLIKVLCFPFPISEARFVTFSHAYVVFKKHVTNLYQ